MHRIGLCFIILFLAAGGREAARAQAGSPAGTRSTAEGVYTKDQAARGAKVQLEMCSSCHFPEDEWTGDEFLGDWLNRSARDLFHNLRETMPEDFPGSLSRQQYADVVAYILQLNGMPAGSSELKTDDGSLARVTIERKKP